MKHALLILILVFGLNQAFAQQKKRSELQTKSSLAIRYYSAKDYEKAIPLLKEVHQLSKNSTYFRYYINCLIELEHFTTAEEEIAKEIKKQKPPRPEFYIHWGRVYKAQNKNKEAETKYRNALDAIPADKGSYFTVANNFLSWGEYEMAKQTYLQGRKALAPEQFNYELARCYLYLRDYSSMMEEYLNLLQASEKQLPRIQSNLSSVMRMDIDNGLRDQFRTQILKRIQAEPNTIGYNRLLIWFLLQEKKFSGALRQCIALDKRTGIEDGQILQIGEMALNNKEYTEARNAFQYIMDKGSGSPFYSQSFARKIHASYLEYTSKFPENKEKGISLAQEFEHGLEYLKYGTATLHLAVEYAHLLTFYLNNPEKALTALNRALNIPQLTPLQTGILKTEMADIYVYANEPWEAMLIYSQVIDANKKNTLGDEVKLKKAKLGYYMGNFSWAKAHLDVLKASTSKLTANDAMELSMMIGNNLNMDTTAVPLTMFARSDLLFFQNKHQEALAVMDSLMELYPYHSLVDDILFRKAKIEIESHNYELASEYLKTITADFSYDLLGDNALFLLAEIYNYHLEEKEKAKNLYHRMLTAHPGSVYTEESRAKYRELREIYPDENKEDLFMEGKKSLFEKAIENTEFQ